MPDPFPPATTAADYARIARDEALLGPGVRAVLESLGLVTLVPGRFAEGSLPVYAIGDELVLKLYPPCFLAERLTESSVLAAVADRLPTPTPRVHATGELFGWGYVLMSRLAGEGLVAAWAQLDDDARLRLAAQLGETLAALHATPPPDAPGVRIDWPAFIMSQRDSAVDRQRAHGLDEHWLCQIPAFLDDVDLRDDGRRCLLHTEVMREHLLAERTPSGWRLSGLFDFEPAMAGAREYELASVGLFFSCGDPRLLRQVLSAFGSDPSSWGRDLERRLLAYALLHRYSNVPWYLRRNPAPAEARTLDALAAHWSCVTGS